MSHQRMHAGGHPHSPKPSRTGLCWLCCALSLLVSSEGANSFLCRLPLPYTDHAGSLSRLKVDRTELHCHMLGLHCSPGRYYLYNADRPVYCPLLGLWEALLIKCKAVGGFRCILPLGHKDEKVPTFGRR